MVPTGDQEGAGGHAAAGGRTEEDPTGGTGGEDLNGQATLDAVSIGHSPDDAVVETARDGGAIGLPEGETGDGDGAGEVPIGSEDEGQGTGETEGGEESPGRD